MQVSNLCPSLKQIKERAWSRFPLMPPYVGKPLFCFHAVWRGRLFQNLLFYWFFEANLLRLGAISYDSGCLWRSYSCALPFASQFPPHSVALTKPIAHTKWSPRRSVGARVIVSVIDDLEGRKTLWKMIRSDKTWTELITKPLDFRHSGQTWTSSDSSARGESGFPIFRIVVVLPKELRL